jgi:hypothetical protein
MTQMNSEVTDQKSQVSFSGERTRRMLALGGSRHGRRAEHAGARALPNQLRQHTYRPSIFPLRVELTVTLLCRVRAIVFLPLRIRA